MKKISATILLILAVSFCFDLVYAKGQINDLQIVNVLNTVFRKTQKAFARYNDKTLIFYFYRNGEYSFSSDNYRVSGTYQLVDQNTGIEFDNQIFPKYARISVNNDGSLRSLRWDNISFSCSTVN